MKSEMIILDKVSQIYRPPEGGKKFTALHEVSFKVPTGQFVSLIGPSGCGKSTLLRSITGLSKPSHGTIENNSKKFAMVFQNFALFPWLSVIENVAFGLKMSGMPKADRDKIAMVHIHDVGLAGFENKRPHELSGGMRQRVAIARALAVSPDLLLMDEPFSSLDEFTAEKLRADLARLWEKYKMTVLMVTHLVEEAVELSDTVVIMSARPGTIKKTVHITLDRPRNKRLQEYYDLVDQITAEIDH
jgi:ABC-type nitrate/sulfonate/bicarbonate transport system ATPase subunit